MAGKRITKKQAEIYIMARNKNCTQIVAAAKADISERSGRSIEKGLWSNIPKPRHWRTRPDPLAAVWDTEIIPMLEKSPGLLPITLLEYLQKKYSAQYPDSVLRTMQRRVKKWKALHGPDKEVIFRQTHAPGKLALSDFTKLKRVKITINGKHFPHLLYHFRLAYSGWSSVKVVMGGESYTALAEGLQRSLWMVGGTPLEHRTDSLSAAFKNLNKEQTKDITKEYDALCSYYNMKPTRNNPGVAHENGSIESPHGHIKRRIRQALLLRGSNDFSSVEEYQEWLDKVIKNYNQRNATKIDIERKVLQKLPIRKTIDFSELSVSVSSSSTIYVKRVIYMVPSRLKGERLKLHIYDDRIVCYLGCSHVLDLPRIYPNGERIRGRLINYKYVISSLIKKPQAFRYSRLRDDLLPSENFGKIWRHVDNSFDSKEACRVIVKLLHIAATSDCQVELENHLLSLIKKSQPIIVSKLQEKFLPKNIKIIPSIEITQHKLKQYNELLKSKCVPYINQKGETNYVQQ